MLETDPYHALCLLSSLGVRVVMQMLANAFKQYSSFAMARVIRDKSSGKSKGYGFVSFLDPFDGLKGGWARPHVSPA